jgi:hypothetical protein
MRIDTTPMFFGWDKGMGEFVQAARQLKSKYPEAEFQLLGYIWACRILPPCYAATLSAGRLG